MMNKEFIDRVEELRVEANKDFSYMLAVTKGDEEKVAEQSLIKKSIVDEIMKDKYKLDYSEAGSFGEMLAMSDSKSKITEDELEAVMDIIAKNFTGKPFKSKDLLPLLPKNAAGEPFLNNRKLPSRLKKLAEFGRLEDKGGKPKSYLLAE